MKLNQKHVPKPRRQEGEKKPNDVKKKTSCDVIDKFKPQLYVSFTVWDISGTTELR